jgi:hypothetical protein
MNITVSEAVDLLYHGRSNVIKAAEACGAKPESLKQLLLERVKKNPPFEPLQLTLLIK